MVWLDICVLEGMACRNQSTDYTPLGASCPSESLSWTNIQFGCFLPPKVRWRSCSNVLLQMSLSPFYAVEKWVEVLDHTPHMKGVPLHVWREAMFRRLGACLGCTLEVDQKTFSREFTLRQSSRAARQIKDLSIQTHSGTEICVIL